MSSLTEKISSFDIDILNKVSREKSLNILEYKLLLIIRIVENGEFQYEMGVNVSKARIGQNKKESLYIQATYAANTIVNRFDYREHNALLSFAKRWCPVNHEIWYKNAKFYWDKYTL